MATRVLVADDHIGFLRGLVDVIQEDADVEIVGVAARGDVALALIRELAPELAILDHDMPGLTGLEIAAAVRAEGLQTRVILLTLYADRTLASRAIEAGVAAYVLKSKLDDDLMPAMTAVLDGGRFVTAAMQPG